MPDDLELTLLAIVAGLCDWMMSLGAPVGLIAVTIASGITLGLILTVCWPEPGKRG